LAMLGTAGSLCSLLAFLVRGMDAMTYAALSCNH